MGTCTQLARVQRQRPVAEPCLLLELVAVQHILATRIASKHRHNSFFKIRHSGSEELASSPQEGMASIWDSNKTQLTIWVTSIIKIEISTQTKAISRGGFPRWVGTEAEQEAIKRRAEARGQTSRQDCGPQADCSGPSDNSASEYR